MKKTALFFILILLLSVIDASGTAQMPDKLVYNGKTYSIFSNPLESYFEKEKSRPDHLFGFSCTAVWRGYVATWSIDDGYLYLIKLVEGTCGSKPNEIPLSKIFPGKETKIKAEWFTGRLKIPQGKMLSYVHMGYGSVYEKELILNIEKGKLISEEVIDNTARKLPSEEEKTIQELQKLKDWEEKTKGREKNYK